MAVNTEQTGFGFHPLVQEWFTRKYGTPTEVQEKSWPRIALNESLVITAPTGSGKTLTAFLSLIDQFIQGKLETGWVRCVYVSPLKALNNDIQRNLVEPLEELQKLFEDAGVEFPTIHVQTRSGDTPQSARARMVRKPPEILVTTPESLMFMLTAKRSQRLFDHVETVILDEIHAVVENRRGAMLMACLERMVDLSGEFQRIALSATVRPLSVIADYVAGFDHLGNSRSIGIVESQLSKQISLTVHMPEAAIRAFEESQPIWEHLVEEFRKTIEMNNSTLVFVESRSMSERIAHDLNALSDSLISYSHHGSLSREIREEVESLLKRGELRSIVATSSLEMGIDIGALDEVLLVQSPQTVSSTLQRIGRSGHRVGDVSRGKLYPTHARDLVDAAALVRAIDDRDIEPLQPLIGPLDLLAQLVVSHVVANTCSVDDVYLTLTRSYPYSTLERDKFDLVIGLLTGRFQDARIRSLHPRIALDRATNQISARKGASLALYASGGVIPDRGYYRLRHMDSGTLIGDLDEEYVWEAKIGQRLTFGTQQWEITSITHNDVNVRSVGSVSPGVPFFRSESLNRDFHFSNLVGNFLYEADQLLEQDDSSSLVNLLLSSGFENSAASHLLDLLHRQRVSTQVLPHKDNLVAEVVGVGPGGYVSEASDEQLILHTNWGGRVNQPIALAMGSAWREKFRSEPDIFCDNYSIVIQLKQEADVESTLELLDPQSFELRLSDSLEKSGFFGARFRECAGRALLLNKTRFDQRVPLWMTRMQSKKLMAASQDFDDFPILIETWRTCLNDEFDMHSARQILQRIAEGAIKTVVVRNKLPSPFALGINYDQIGRYMYEQDEPEQRRNSGISSDLIDSAIQNPELRPVLSRSVVEEFERKIQRRITNYEPESQLELEEWVKARIWIPREEWFDGLEPSPVLTELKAHRWTGFTHPENDTFIQENPIQAVANALQFYGPHSREEFARIIPIDSNRLDSILDELLANEVLVNDVQVSGRDELLTCDRENLDILLRLQRSANRVSVDPISIKQWSSYLIAWQDLADKYGKSESVLDIVECLRGYAAPVTFWLRDAWLSRLGDIPFDEIEQNLNSQEICWRGVDREKIAFGLHEDIAISAPSRTDLQHIESEFADPRGSYTFNQLLANSSASFRQFNEAFWNSVWNGFVSSDSLTPLRAGMKRKFKGRDRWVNTSRDRRLRRRSAHLRPRNAWPGTWYLTCVQPEPEEPLMRLEDQKERVRVLLDRYGIISREVANREGRDFRWQAIFEALRLMELSGEIVGGLFVTEFSGPQFARSDAIRALTNYSTTGVSWISAYDAIAPCGLGIDWPELPARRVGNYLGLIDGEVVCSSTAQGRKLQVFIAPDDNRLHLLFVDMARAITDERSLSIEEINGVPARSSQYAESILRSTNAYRDHAKIYVELEDFSNA
ncbi:MAG: DEAD/DEAH box helicase [Gammaproteobacteria bacterium]|nr:DEAD/DEAH box helicase [Gammaproteobacteria bacterium]